MTKNISLSASGISRRKKQSVVATFSYASGMKLWDAHRCKPHYASGRKDVTFYEMALPASAPDSLKNYQAFFDAWNGAESRKDASMGHKYIVALPRELSREQQVEVVRTFIYENFTKFGYPALYAIHSGKADEHPKPGSIPAVEKHEDNPHVHIITAARRVDKHGFQATKVAGRVTYKREFLLNLRKNWANLLNATFERLALDTRFDYRSYKEQGIDRLPTRHIGPRAMALEMKAVKTTVGAQHQEIIQQNTQREAQRTRDVGREYVEELELER